MCVEECGEVCEKAGTNVWKPPSLANGRPVVSRDDKWKCVLSAVTVDPADARMRVATLQSDPLVVGFIIGKNGQELKRLTQQAGDCCRILHKEAGLFEPTRA